MEFRIDPNFISSLSGRSFSEKFEFPYDWINFSNIEVEIKNLINSLIASEEQIVKDVFAINYHFHMSYLAYIHVKKLLSSVKLKGGKPIYDEENTYIDSINKKDYSENNFSLVTNKKKYGFTETNLKTLSFNLRNNLSFSTKTAVIGNTAGYNTIRYLKQGKNNLVWKPAESFFPQLINNDSIISNYYLLRIKEILNNFQNKLAPICDKYEISIGEEQKKKILIKHENDFAIILNYYLALNETNDSNRLPEEYYIGSNNNIYLRILTAYLKNIGKIVMGFSHGNPFWHMYDLTSWLELSLNSHFIVPTKKSSEILKDLVKLYPTPNSNDCIIDSQFINDKRINYFIKKNVQSNSSKVLVVAPPFMREISPFSFSLPNLILLQIMNEVIAKFKLLNYSVVLQKHPGGTSVKNLNSALNFVAISDQPFESIYKNFDLLFFMHTRTTTITNALYSNIPIILCEGHNEPVIHHLMREQILKRCAIINVDYTDKFTLSINDNKLKAASEEAYIKRNDKSFLNQYVIGDS